MSDSQAEKPASTTTALDQVSIPRLFFALLHKRFTGTLELQQPEPNAGTRTVWIRGGMPVFTDWVVAEDTLGQILLELGSITPQILTEALQSIGPNEPLGKVLVDRGAVDTQRLASALRDQCGRKLVHLFKLRTGMVTIVGVNHTRGKDDEHWQVNVLELIQRGVSRHYDESRAVAELGADADGKLLATTSFARYRNHFKFTSEDEVVLQALTKGTHFQALVNQPGMNRDRAAQVTYMLWACQMLQRDAEGQRAAASRPAPRPRPQPSPAPKRAPAPASDAAPPQASPPTPAAQPPPSAPPPERPRAAAPAKPAPAKPETPAPEPTAEADPEFLAELERFEGLIADGTHAFDLLGVALDATKRDVRRAWGGLSRTYHPDALQAKGLGHLRERVEQVFAALSEAQLTLSDAEQREQLKRVIEAGGDTSRPDVDAAALARAALEAEVVARDGDKLLGAGKFDRALAKYERALELTPEEPDIRSAILWCRFQLSSKTAADADVAGSGIDLVLQDAPNLARAHYFRGMIHLQQGNERRALQSLNAAHEADPKLVDAERQARAIMARRTPDKKKKKGLFGR